MSVRKPQGGVRPNQNWSHPNGRPRASRPPWTEEQLSLLEQMMDLKPSHEIANIVSKSPQAVEAKIHRIKKAKGETVKGAPSWSVEEIAFLIANQHRTLKELSEELGRTRIAVATRRKVLRQAGFKVTNNTLTPVAPQHFAIKASEDPWHIGARLLLVRTCDQCGIIKPGHQFKITRKDVKHFGEGASRSKKCNRCTLLMQMDKLGHDEFRRRNTVKAKQVNDYVRQFADRNGFEYTSSDHEVLAQRNKTYIQKALEMGRTVSGVAGAVSRFGYHASVGSKIDGLWIVSFVREHVESAMREAAIKRAEVVFGIVIPESLWDWNY